MRYKISHITDLMQIPPEHWDECVRDIRGCIVSLHLVEAAALCTPGVNFVAADACPVIIFTPDGKGEITPIINGEPMFTMTISRDESNAPDDRASEAGSASIALLDSGDTK